MTTWTITYDNGEEFLTAHATGKLSLDTWMFIIDPTRQPATIILAIPAWRVISIVEA